MVLQLPAPSPAVGLFLAQQLLILREGTNPSLIGANIAADTGRGNSQGDIPSTDVYPRGWWVRDANTTYLFINGSESLLQATLYVDFLSGTNVRLPYPHSRYWLSNGNDNYLLPGIQPTDTLQAGTLLVAGHSLGGVFAQSIIKTASIRNIRSARAAVTYGSPKFVQRPNGDLYQGLNLTRWMNDNDPVPLVPPPVVNNIQALGALFPAVLQYWSLFHQLAGGISVAPSGVTDDLAIPPLGVINFAAALANWLWDIYSSRETVHDLPEYVRRLTNVVTRTTPPAAARVIDSGPERPADLSRRDANRQINDAIQSIIHVAGRQNAAVLAVPPSRAFVPAKIGPIWWVTFGGQLVAVGPRRKACGLMCVRGNEFLRRLQRMGGVDGNALSRLLGEYIEAASMPDNGFSPTIARLDS